jgi:hypothetical protein
VIDHWLWVVMGLQGLVGMMQKLLDAEIPITPQAKTLLQEHLTRLNDIAGKVK